MLKTNHLMGAEHIPVFFSTDDNYVPYLDIAISSLIDNANKAYQYRIIVLHTGLEKENILKIKQNECRGFVIDFADISGEVKKIQSRFKSLYHFSVVTYYRLFISSLFPQYEKVLYLDCDLVVLGDISELYLTDIGENILGAVRDQYVPVTQEFRMYVENAIGIDCTKYINAGVLLMNLNQFRKCEIEQKFLKLLTEYDFDLVDPDQAYLNYLCNGKIHLLPNGWNKVPGNLACEGKKNIVHYALYKKPWQYDDVTDGDCFWHYAKKSPFYALINDRKRSFGAAEIAEKENSARNILEHAARIAGSGDTISKKLCIK